MINFTFKKQNVTVLLEECIGPTYPPYKPPEKYDVQYESITDSDLFFSIQKMLHRQASVQPINPNSQSGPLPVSNQPHAQPSAPVSQPQAMVNPSLILTC